jgi:ribonuclease HI
MNEITIFTDGGARGNPGPAASAFVIFEGEKLIASGTKYLGETTNNVAEYQAVVLALEFIENKWGSEIKNLQLNFNLDSLLVVSQLTGAYKIKNQNLIVLSLNTKNKLKGFAGVSFKYVPRKENARADALVNKCLDEN